MNASPRSVHSIAVRTVLALVMMAALGGIRADAEGALAIGLPRDVAQDGVTMGLISNVPNADAASAQALANCKSGDASDAAKALCSVVQVFHDQCAAGAEDQADGTPGVGWAIADGQDDAEHQALDMCKSKSAASRRDECVVVAVRCDGTAH